ncbi:M28 family metallopeptidase [Altererythrobacter sp.]|uniref:M28 family metallopeptidase n=1 Tax=Altererythrobacter sp. TaxID=1872480 RepID=UPI001B240541|nr:M28 family metallopeptidase [Altererythrobacter sp.]MBO6609521.1 M28 family peptidase [Altererythrobacter sp.]MBO6642388.1 M28 family peptidase [Altererythrobacter sp.]MBO6709104.1 M28 family peptidase [Altererythrobacter sp.]
MITTRIKTGFIAATAALTLTACDMMGTIEPALDIPEVAAGDISQATMVDITRTLSSDEFEGRMPGTIGEELTVALLTEKFEAAGIQPGNGDSWVQDVPLVEITGKNFAPLTITNGETDLVYDFGSEWVGVTYREDAQTQLANSELVFVGYGINAPERDWNDYEGVDVTGKTVVILVNDPDWQTQGLEGPFNGRAMTYYGRWTYKYEEAARQGAAGAIIVHDTEPASYGWNVVESSWSGAQAYPEYGANAPARTLVNGWVQKDVAREILSAAGQDLDALSVAAKSKDFKPVELGFTASTSFQNDIRKFMSKNVIGLLPGATRPDEYVIHTAHWDHLGRCTAAPDGDDICNGAVDNATGTAALVALAEAHGKAGAPDRSLVFLAVTAEESGLLGAHYYAENPVFPLAQTVGGINMDAFDMAGPAKDVTVVGPGKSQLDLFLEAALVADGRVQTPNPSPEAGYYYRSDHFAFAKRGVPMLYLDGGQDLIDGGREAGAALADDYRANRYHGPKDEFDENWDWSGVMADLQLFYRLGRMMAMSTSWPNWNEGDEFKATRDAACAGSETGC